MRRAAKHTILQTLRFGEFERFCSTQHHIYTMFYFVQLLLAVFFSLHQIELARRRGAFGVDHIAQTGCRQSTAFVVQLRENNLGRNRIIQSAGTQPRRRIALTRIGVAGLRHKIFYHAVKQQPIVKTFVHEFHKIVAMLRRLVVQPHFYSPQRRCKFHQFRFRRLLGTHGRRQHRQTQQQTSNFSTHHVRYLITICKYTLFF